MTTFAFCEILSSTTPLRLMKCPWMVSIWSLASFPSLNTLLSLRWISQKKSSLLNNNWMDGKPCASCRVHRRAWWIHYATNKTTYGSMLSTVVFIRALKNWEYCRKKHRSSEIHGQMWARFPCLKQVLKWELQKQLRGGKLPIWLMETLCLTRLGLPF